MNINLPVWAYYQDKFVHPDFVPYQRYPTKTSGIPPQPGTDVCEVENINTWKSLPCSNAVEPALIRRGWGWNFMLKHPDDPCPPGWEKDPLKLGWCVREEREFEPLLYTDKAFIPKNQYWTSYTSSGDSNTYRQISEPTDMRSVNPITGKYTIYFNSVPYTPPTQTAYKRCATPDSYLG